MLQRADRTVDDGPIEIIRGYKKIFGIYKSWYDLRRNEEIKRLINEYKTELNAGSLNKEKDAFHKFSYYNPEKNFIMMNVNNMTIKINLKDGSVEMQEFSKENLFLSKIEVDYDEAADYSFWADKLQEILITPEYVNLVRYYMAYCMINKYFKWGICLMFYGPRALNGKSTIIETFASLFRNVEAAPLHKISKNFGRQHLKDADFINADESHIDFADNGSIKKIVLGHKDFIENKGVKNETARIDSKIMAACNVLLPAINADPGMNRRFEIVPTPRSFQHDEDTNLQDKLLKMKPGILNWIIGIFPDLIKNIDKLKLNIGERTRRFFDEHDSPLKVFADAYIDGGTSMRIDELHVWYETFSKRNNHPPLTKTGLGKEVTKLFNQSKNKRSRSNLDTSKLTTNYTELSLDIPKLIADLGPLKGFDVPTSYFDDWEKEELVPHSKLQEWILKEQRHTKLIIEYGVNELKMTKENIEKWIQTWIDEKIMHRKGEVWIVRT